MSKSFIPRMTGNRRSQQIAIASSIATDLVPGSQISRTTLDAGVTTTAVTFNAFTGGSTHTLSASIDAPVGASTTVSGSGLGPYTIQPLEDNGDYIVMLQATDDTDSQIANSYIYISVNSVSAPVDTDSWTLEPSVVEVFFETLVMTESAIRTHELIITSPTEEAV